jgi:hypothetical protein
MRFIAKTFSPCEILKLSGKVVDSLGRREKKKQTEKAQLMNLVYPKHLGSFLPV